jgi:anthranilate phosphoribosyltransferase
MGLQGDTMPGKSKEEAASPVDFVKKVGRGKTLSQDLTAAEAAQAFRLLLEGAFTSAQAGAFLQALRIKELTQAELDALAERFRPPGDRPPLAGAHTLVLNLASDTSRKGGLASLLAAAGLRRFGIGVGVVRSAPVLSRNAASFEGTWALAKSVDPEIGASMDPAAAALLASPPLRLAAVSELIPGLAALDALRGELGFRSCLHTAEKLVNPWPASPVLLGISHKHYALRMAGTLRALGLRGRILLGNHGTVDLVLHKETEMVSVGPDGIREESVSPAELGLTLSSDVYSLARFVDWGEWLKDPKGSGAGLDQVILYHEAIFLWAAGAAPDPAAGLRMARASRVV